MGAKLTKSNKIYQINDIKCRCDDCIRGNDTIKGEVVLIWRRVTRSLDGSLNIGCIKSIKNINNVHVVKKTADTLKNNQISPSLRMQPKQVGLHTNSANLKKFLKTINSPINKIKNIPINQSPKTDIHMFDSTISINNICSSTEALFNSSTFYENLLLQKYLYRC